MNTCAQSHIACINIQKKDLLKYLIKTSTIFLTLELSWRKHSVKSHSPHTHKALGSIPSTRGNKVQLFFTSETSRQTGSKTVHPKPQKGQCLMTKMAERTKSRNETSNASFHKPTSAFQNVTLVLIGTLATAVLAALDFKCHWAWLLCTKRIMSKKIFFEVGSVAHVRVLDYHAWGPELGSQHHIHWVWWFTPLMEVKAKPSSFTLQIPVADQLGIHETPSQNNNLSWRYAQQFQRTSAWFLALTLGHSQSHGTPVPGESSSLFWPPQAPSLFLVLTYKQSKHILKIQI